MQGPELAEGQAQWPRESFLRTFLSLGPWNERLEAGRAVLEQC